MASGSNSRITKFKNTAPEAILKMAETANSNLMLVSTIFKSTALVAILKNGEKRQFKFNVSEDNF